MNGQMKSSKEKDLLIEEYIKRTNPYKPLVPMKFDMRGYSAYLKEHSISRNNVPKYIMEMFIK